MADNGDLGASADRLNSSLDSVLSKLKEMNRLAGDFSTKLSKSGGIGGGGASGSGNTGAGSARELGTNGATFTNFADKVGGGMGGIGAALSFAGPVGKIAGGALALGGSLIKNGAKTMPSMNAVLDRATTYYSAGLMNGNRTTRSGMQSSTLNALGNGITSPGSDAAVAAAMTGSGINFSTDKNSTYQMNVRNVGNTAKYLGISNEAAATSLAGLTSGGQSAQLMTMGIQTSGKNGKMLSEAQIFEQFYQRATAGRPKATVEDTMESIHRGALGQMIQNSGLDAVEQQKLAQYFIDKAGGSTMDLSNNAATDKQLKKTEKAGNRNPLESQYKANAADTRSMGKHEKGYIDGMATANDALSNLTDTVSDVTSAFAGLKGALDTFGGHPTGQGVLGLVGMGGGGNAPSMSNFGATSGLGGNSGKGLGEAPTASAGGSVDMSMVSSGHNINSGGNWNEVRTLSGGKKTNPHGGIDYNYAVGDPVKAIADGTVHNVGTNYANTFKSGGQSLGGQVAIVHEGADGKKFTSIYGHLSKVMVTKGQKVKKGDTIGLAGNSGYSDGAHLHFELRKGTFKTGAGGAHPESWIDPGSAGTLKTSGEPGEDTVTVSTTTDSSSNSYSLSSDVGNSTISSGISGITSTQYSVASGLGAGGPGLGGSNGSVGDVEMTAAGYTGSSMLSGGAITGRRGSRSGNNVTINLSIASASEVEARRFASLVKKHLEEDALMTNMGVM